MRPWLPFPANAATHAAASQIGDPASMHSLYRQLLELRHERPVLRRGSIEFAPVQGDVIRYERRLGDRRVVVLVNLGDLAVAWPADVTDATVLLSTDRTRTGPGGELGADEAVVLEV
jgi:glycosidase